MRKRMFNLAYTILTAFCLLGCSDGDSDSFSFVILSDPHVQMPCNLDGAEHCGTANLQNLSAALANIRRFAHDAEFVVVTGDLVDCLFSEDPDDYSPGGENPAELVKTAMVSLGSPWYPVFGNHDYCICDPETGQFGPASDSAAVEAVWRKVLGTEPYYSFVHKGVRLIVLGSGRGIASETPCSTCDTGNRCVGSFDEAQLSWLEDQLAGAEPCLLFFHHPLVTDKKSTLWSFGGRPFQVDPADRFYEIAEANRSKIKAIFVGHGHLTVKDTLFGTIPVYETGSTGERFGDPMNWCEVRVNAGLDRYLVRQ